MILLDALKPLKNRKYVLINLRNNKKIRCIILDYDKHFNMFIRDVTEIIQNKDRIIENKIEKMFLRGDNIIAIVF